MAAMFEKVYGFMLAKRLGAAERTLQREAPEAWNALHASRMLGGLCHGRQAMRLLELSRLLQRFQPESVLELGGGTTTTVFAKASRAGLIGEPRIVSMEEDERWERIARTITPVELRSRVMFCLRSRVVERWEDQAVARYDMTYDRYYDLVYVDGPSAMDPDNRTPGHKLPLVDVLCLIKAGFPPRVILVDCKRHSIAFFLRSGIDRYYNLTIRSEFLPWPRPLVAPYRYHSIFERK